MVLERQAVWQDGSIPREPNGLSVAVVAPLRPQRDIVCRYDDTRNRLGESLGLSWRFTRKGSRL